MDIRLLGPVEVWVADHLIDAGPARQRAVLTALAVDIGRPARVESLVDRVWGEAPPSRARHNLHVYLARLRQVLATAGVPGSLVRRSGGYLLDLPPDAVDVHRFRSLRQRAGEAPGATPEHAELLRQALSLWRGEPLAGLSGEWAARVREDWHRQRTDTTLEWARTLLRLGDPTAVLDPLIGLAEEHPLDETVAAALMTALTASGRGAQALERYAELRHRLAESLGADPGAELRELHRAILRGEVGAASGAAPTSTAGPPVRREPAPAPLPPDPRRSRDRPVEPSRSETPPHPLRVHRRRLGLSQEDLAATTGLSVRSIQSLESGRVRSPRSMTIRLLADALRLTETERAGFVRAMLGEDDDPGGTPTPGGQDDGPPRPAQLPADLPDFTGREAVAGLLVAALKSAGRPAVVSVSGMAGVGKTSLGLHVAHRVLGQYPDGQLFADLRGSDPQPVDAFRAAGSFLRALGTPAVAVPTDPDERSALLRSVLARRSLLMLLDNVGDAGSVLPLLPGTGTVAVLMTSRKPLTGVPVTFAVDVDVFSQEESLHLLSVVGGAERTLGDPAAAADVAATCGRLPLAVRLAAARLAARPAWSMRDLADRISASGRRLDELGGADQGVRASFDLSYRALPKRLAQAFRHLAWASLGDLSVDTVAAALGVDRATATTLAEELVDARLLASPRSGRYRYHDLVRLYARERSQREDPPDRAARVVRLMVEAYRKTALAAKQTVEERSAPPFQDAGQASRWLAEESPLIVAAVCQATEFSADVDPEVCADLARALEAHLRFAGEWDEWYRLADAVREISVRHGHGPGELLARMQLGHLAILRNDFDLAADHLDAARGLSRALDDRAAEARVLDLIGLLRFCQADPRRAVEAHRAALSLFDGLGHTAGALNARINLAKCLATQGRGDEGLTVIDEAGRGLPPGAHGPRVMLLHQTARCLNAVGRYDEAIREHERCLALVRRHGMREGEAYVLAELGLTLVAAGQPATARANLTAAVRQFEQLGDRNAADTYRVVLGLAHRALGDLDLASDAWQRAIRLSDPVAPRRTG